MLTNKLHTSCQSEDSLLKRKKAKFEKLCTCAYYALIFAKHFLKFQVPQVSATAQVLNIGDIQIQNLKNWSTSKMLAGQTELQENTIIYYF